MSEVSAMVARLIAAGTPAEIAATVVAEAFAAGVTVAQMSGGRPVDAAMERRRAYDRERKRLTRGQRLPESDWLNLVSQVLKRDGNVCKYCGSTNRLTADHVVPMSRGGSHDLSNLVACCLSCNSKKGNKLLSEWLPNSADVHQTPPTCENALSFLDSNSQSEIEIKKEKKKERAKRQNGELLSADWQPTEQHYQQGIELNLSKRDVDMRAEDMRLWARANQHRAVARKADWNATFSGWMRRSAPNGASNGSGHGPAGNGIRANPPSGPPKSGADAVLAGMGRLAARIAEKGASARSNHGKIPGDRNTADVDDPQLL